MTQNHTASGQSLRENKCQPTRTDGQQQQSTEQHSKNGSSSFSSLVPTAPLDPSAATILVGPGQVPGSKRLHLSHTGRMAHFRASVPSSIQPTCDIGLSPVLEAADLAVERRRFRPNQPTPPGTIATPPSTSTPTPDSSGTQRDANGACCVAARNEVDRLFKQNTDLKQELSSVQESKRRIEDRLKQLEERMESITVMASKLEDEKVGLRL